MNIDLQNFNALPQVFPMQNFTSTCGGMGGFLAGELLLLATGGEKVEKGILGELEELEEA